MKRKKSKRGILIKRADTALSLIVRKTEADENGITKCYTCNWEGQWKGTGNLQCGHYISRAFLCVRWDKNNNRTQCYACNIRKNGNSHIFRRHLLKDIGEKEIAFLEMKATGDCKMKTEDIEKITYSLEAEWESLR